MTTRSFPTPLILHIKTALPTKPMSSNPPGDDDLANWLLIYNVFPGNDFIRGKKFTQEMANRLHRDGGIDSFQDLLDAWCQNKEAYAELLKVCSIKRATISRLTTALSSWTEKNCIWSYNIKRNIIII